MRVQGVLAAAALVFTMREARGEECARPTDPQGFAGYTYEGATPVHFDTAGVRVWYTLSGEHAVRPASTRSDGVPDDVVRVGAVTEDALQRYGAMGYRAPLSDEDPTCGSNGGDDRLDVYLVHFAGADGTTVAERCKTTGATAMCSSFVLAEANFEGRYATVDEGIRTVLSHETFHAVQNAYDAELDRFWAEGTAQWGAKTLDPSLGDLERFLPAFFAEEGRSIDVPPGGVTARYLYGAAIWPVFLANHYDPAIIREVLEEEASSGASALDAAGVVLERRQTSLHEAWSTFWLWNASTADRADPNGYPDAARYPLAPTRELADVAKGVTSGSTAYVYHLASSARVTVALEASTDAHVAYLVPLEGGKTVLAKAAPLPATIDRESLVVLTSLSKSKVDAPYTLRVTAAPDAAPPSGPSPPAAEPTGSASGGCSATGAAPGWSGYAFAVGATALALSLRRRALFGQGPRVSAGPYLCIACRLDATSGMFSVRSPTGHAATIIELRKVLKARG